MAVQLKRRETEVRKANEWLKSRECENETKQKSVLVIQKRKPGDQHNGFKMLVSKLGHQQHNLMLSEQSDKIRTIVANNNTNDYKLFLLRSSLAKKTPCYFM